MVDISLMRQLAMSFPNVTEEAHIEKTSFRIRKKIFATYDGATNQACLKLSEIDQDVFSTFDKSIVWPVPNKWGKQGWTFVDLAAVHPDMFTDALTTAYETVTSGKRGAI